ncbi:tetratricopeptide repeat protein [Marinobacter halophilus]|uniref:Tetratricopeptide repeat protein n=1 Tax=Marinobacter halophilus TaxID=1323740 RepID=A0A2T1KK13_9GAMM|nr:tetratricopeptide repeat protein [Marinobacter halophilus]PSF10415.1 hypothetical protein C7H08_02700 [Marinobacter halophilus]GGC70575.1 hypothetical protein GCM10011362_18850 [Marinobacter halophilus]
MFRLFTLSGLSLGLFILTLAGTAVAEEPAVTGQQAMSAGIDQFRQGDYQAARAHFEVALKFGVDTAALHYNLAVACFKAGDYRAAEVRFSTMLDGPHKSLAQYNLGLVALADGREEEAVKWFRQTARPEAPDTLRELAQRQLTELERTHTRPLQNSRTATQGYLSAGAGYDSNMAGVPDDSPSNRGSLFAELVAAGTLSRTFSPDWRIVWDGVLYSQDYVRSRRYDTSVLQSRVAGIRTYDQVEFGARAGASRAWLSDNELETRFGLTVFAWSEGCSWLGWLQACSAALAVEQIEGGPGYAAYDGQWYQFEVRGEWAFGSLVMEAFYSWQSNDRDNFRQETYFVSLSPTLHEVGVEARYLVRSDLSIGVDAELRQARYDQPHQWLHENELVKRRREDVRVEFGLTAEFYLNSQWLVRNQWWFSDQDSRIDRNDYQRYSYTVSLEGEF